MNFNTLNQNYRVQSGLPLLITDPLVRHFWQLVLAQQLHLRHLLDPFHCLGSTHTANSMSCTRLVLEVLHWLQASCSSWAGQASGGSQQGTASDRWDMPTPKVSVKRAHRGDKVLQQVSLANTARQCVRVHNEVICLEWATIWRGSLPVAVAVHHIGKGDVAAAALCCTGRLDDHNANLDRKVH